MKKKKKKLNGLSRSVQLLFTKIITIILEWFEYYNFDTNLECHRYKLQRSNESWKRIHSITIISVQPKWHFVHDCGNDCAEGNHDIVNNRIFYKNDYLYTAV